MPSLSLTGSREVEQQLAPLTPELVGAGQTAVAPDHTQVGDAQLDQVVCRLHTALPGLEVCATGTADNSAALEKAGWNLTHQITLSNVILDGFLD